MSDTLGAREVSRVRRGAVLAAWVSLLALWGAPYFLPFRGVSRGFVWRHADCGLAKASFPQTCAPGAVEATASHACEPLGSTLAKTWAGASAAPIDDLEMGASVSEWFAVNDGNGLQFPERCAMRSALNGERGPNNDWAMHTYGRSAEGFQWAMIGRHVRTSAPRCDHPIDATGFSGVRFWAKGLGAVRLAVATTATTALDHGGTCRQHCYDNHQAILELTPVWAKYEVPFAALTQLGFGEPVALQTSQIMDVTWGAADTTTDYAGTCFDFWVDDVAFYR